MTAVLAFVVAVMFVLASLAAPEERLVERRRRSVRMSHNTVTQVMEKHLLDPIAVQKIEASRL